MIPFGFFPTSCSKDSCGSSEFRELSRQLQGEIEIVNYECKKCLSITTLKSTAWDSLNSKKPEDKKLTKFPSGATRSSDADDIRYDLCPSMWSKRDAIIMAEGAATHGDDNWKKGIPINVCLNHLERHLNLWKSGDQSEDHLAKVRVNAGFIMWFEEKGNRYNENES